MLCIPIYFNLDVIEYSCQLQSVINVPHDVSRIKVMKCYVRYYFNKKTLNYWCVYIEEKISRYIGKFIYFSDKNYILFAGISP